MRLPPFARCALLLDMDGTLLDIAPTPATVVVAPDLPPTLTRLCATLAGALAVVTGRPVEQIDALLPGIVPVVAGEHGGALRSAPGAALQRAALPEPPPELLQEVAALVAGHPGAILERKARGFVLHYRLAPAAGPVFRTALEGLMAPHAGFQIMAAHMAWEVRPGGMDKGSAVAAIMALPHFAGRLPVFIGDDVTDEDGMAVARSMGGAGLLVPEVFGDAAGVRDWLARCVDDWAPFQ